MKRAIILASLFFFHAESASAWMATAPLWNKQLNLLAGGPGINAVVNGTLDTAGFYDLQGIARDPSGNLYAVDSPYNTIRKIATDGNVTSFAGGTQGTSDGTGSAAQFYNPNGIVSDSLGNLYVADRWNHSIRKITPAGVVTTFAGVTGTIGTTDGTGAAAGFAYPTGVAVDSVDNIYVASKDNQTIRKITPAGVVTTIAGTLGSNGSVNANGTSAKFNSPFGLAVDASNNIYVADSQNYTIRKITPTYDVTTIAGSALSSGTATGTGSSARFNLPLHLAINLDGDILVADYGNHAIRKVTPAGVVTNFAGLPGTNGYADGNGTAARFSSPVAIVGDGAGNFYVTDSGNDCIRKIDSAGNVTTLTGQPANGQSDGVAGRAKAYRPGGVYVNAAGEAYFSDNWNHTIRKIAADGTVTTIAGTPGSSGTATGTGSAARFTYPGKLIGDASGNIYIADNHSIRKLSSTNVVTNFAGTPGVTGHVDDTGTAAQFGTISGLTMDSSGNIFATDSSYHTIRKITPAGVVTTYSGTVSTTGSNNGAVATATFSAPNGIAIDSSDNLYVSDSGNNVIRKITAAGVVSTLAGTVGSSGTTDGSGAAARFASLKSITSDADGTLYTVSGNVVRKITPSADVTTVIGSNSSSTLKLGPLPASLATFWSSSIYLRKNKLYLTSDSSILWAFKP